MLGIFGQQSLQALKSPLEGYEAWCLQCLTAQSPSSVDKQPFKRRGGPELPFFPGAEPSKGGKSLSALSKLNSFWLSF